MHFIASFKSKNTWICHVCDIQLWVDGIYVPETLQTLVLDSLLRKSFLQIRNWKSPNSFFKNYNSWLFRLSVHMLRIVYELKWLYTDSQHQ